MSTGTAIFQQVDEFAESKLIGNDPALSYALKNSAKNGLPPISVSATQGKFLMMQAKLIGAKRILEVGTLGGWVRAECQLDIADLQAVIVAYGLQGLSQQMENS